MNRKKYVIPREVVYKLNVEAMQAIEDHPLSEEIGNQMLILLELGCRIKRCGDVYIPHKVKGECPTLKLTKMLKTTTETQLFNATHDFKLRIFDFVK